MIFAGALAYGLHGLSDGVWHDQVDGNEIGVVSITMNRVVKHFNDPAFRPAPGEGFQDAEEHRIASRPGAFHFLSFCHDVSGDGGGEGLQRLAQFPESGGFMGIESIHPVRHKPARQI